MASGATPEGDEDFAMFEGGQSGDEPEEVISALQKAGLRDMRPALRAFRANPGGQPRGKD